MLMGDIHLESLQVDPGHTQMKTNIDAYGKKTNKQLLGHQESLGPGRLEMMVCMLMGDIDSVQVSENLWTPGLTQIMTSMLMRKTNRQPSSQQESLGPGPWK